MQEKLKTFWAESTTNKVVVIAGAVGVVYLGKKAWDKYKK